MKFSTYKRLKSLGVDNRRTQRFELRIEAAERRREFARHVRLFTREGLLSVVARFSEKYYTLMRQLRLDRFGITS